MAHKIKARASILIAIAVSLGILAMLAYRRSRTLLAMATPVRGFTIHGNASENDLWLNDHDYLTTGSFYPRTQLSMVSTAAHTCATIARFSLPPVKFHVRGAMISHPGTLAQSIDANAVSQDRTKALVNSTGGWQLVDLVTGNTRRLEADPGLIIRDPRGPYPLGNAAWMPNGRDWVSTTLDFDKPTRLTVHDPRGHPIASGQIGRWRTWYGILGVLPGDIVLLAGEDSCLHQVDTRHGFAMRSWPYPSSQDFSAIDPQLSPDKRHMLWTAGTRHDWPRIPGLSGRLLPPAAVYTKIALLTDLDGSHQQEIGRYSTVFNGDDITRIAWMPDGRHISFMYHDKLWIMPVDAP
jgi:hypothetical protein